MRFTQEPSNPSYFKNGSDANLVWNYTDPLNKIQSILYSVLVKGAFVKMMVNDSRGKIKLSCLVLSCLVQDHPAIPVSYKGRVKVEGRATLVIKNINPEDSTKFKCELTGSFINVFQSTVQLIVAGTYYRYNH